MNALVTAGTLSSSNGNALDRQQLNTATTDIQNAQHAAAASELNAFINQVSSLPDAGNLWRAASAQTLILAANNEIASSFEVSPFGDGVACSEMCGSFLISSDDYISSFAQRADLMKS